MLVFEATGEIQASDYAERAQAIEDPELRDAPLIPPFIERRVAGVDAYLRTRAKTEP